MRRISDALFAALLADVAAFAAATITILCAAFAVSAGHAKGANALPPQHTLKNTVLSLKALAVFRPRP
jgi:hypothetical protein